MVKFTISLISALLYLKTASQFINPNQELKRVKREDSSDVSYDFGEYNSFSFSDSDYSNTEDPMDADLYFDDDDFPSEDDDTAFYIEYEYEEDEETSNDIDVICKADLLDKLAELDGQYDPDFIADVTCKGEYTALDSLDDCVSACTAARSGKKKKRKLGTTYSRWKAVSRMIQHVVQNTNLSRKQLIRKMLNYGCHCFPGSKKRRSVGGKGPAMDEIDSVCKQQYHCHKCIELEHQCNPDKTGYRVKFIGKRRSLTRDIVCRSAEGTCSRDLCECDKAMAYTLAGIWDDTKHNIFFWLDSKNKKRNPTFDYENTCVASGTGGGSNACCGDFPDVIPYDNNARQCCATDPTKPRTYNPNSHDCCPSGGVSLIGSC